MDKFKICQVAKFCCYFLASDLAPSVSPPKNFLLLLTLSIRTSYKDIRYLGNSVLRFYDHVLSIVALHRFCMKMLLVLTLALFVGLASSRPSDKAIGKDQKNQQNFTQ